MLIRQVEEQPGSLLFCVCDTVVGMDLVGLQRMGATSTQKISQDLQYWRLLSSLFISAGGRVVIGTGHSVLLDYACFWAGIFVVRARSLTYRPSSWPNRSACQAQLPAWAVDHLQSCTFDISGGNSREVTTGVEMHYVEYLNREPKTTLKACMKQLTARFEHVWDDISS